MQGEPVHSYSRHAEGPGVPDWYRLRGALRDDVQAPRPGHLSVARGLTPRGGGDPGGAAPLRGGGSTWRCEVFRSRQELTGRKERAARS